MSVTNVLDIYTHSKYNGSIHTYIQLSIFCDFVRQCDELAADISDVANEQRVVK
jgi:hypothetical protein